MTEDQDRQPPRDGDEIAAVCDVELAEKVKRRLDADRIPTPYGSMWTSKAVLNACGLQHRFSADRADTGTGVVDRFYRSVRSTLRSASASPGQLQQVGDLLLLSPRLAHRLTAVAAEEPKASGIEHVTAYFQRMLELPEVAPTQPWYATADDIQGHAERMAVRQHGTLGATRRLLYIERDGKRLVDGEELMAALGVQSPSQRADLLSRAYLEAGETSHRVESAPAGKNTPARDTAWVCSENARAAVRSAVLRGSLEFAEQTARDLDRLWPGFSADLEAEFTGGDDLRDVPVPVQAVLAARQLRVADEMDELRQHVQRLETDLAELRAVSLGRVHTLPIAPAAPASAPIVTAVSVGAVRRPAIAAVPAPITS